MEVHAFNTDNVEGKLNDIAAALNAMYFAVLGLKNLNLISDMQLSAFDYIIRDAKVKAESLVYELKPVLTDSINKIILLYCSENDNTE